MKSISYFLFGMIAMIMFCSKSDAKPTITVAVAANAWFVAQELKTNFENIYPIDVKLIMGSSGKLTTQILNGAPYDLFLSADMSFPNKIYDAGLAISSPTTYALGKIVLWTLKKPSSQDIKTELLNKNIATIAIANPSIAPYGKATLQALKQMKIDNLIKQKIVYGESIAQVNQYLLGGIVSVAFTAESVVQSPELKNKGYWIPIPAHVYTPIKQGVVILKHALRGNLSATQSFYRFLMGSKGRRILTSFGYDLPQ